MIGQRELLKKIDGQIKRDKYPRISVLIGEKGSGRKTLATHIAKELNPDMFIVGPDVKDIADILDLANKGVKVALILDDLDSKPDLDVNFINNITENTYIIITCESFDNLPHVVQNGAVSYTIEPYYDNDKFDAIYEIDDIILDEGDEEFIVDTASTLGDVKMLCALNIKEFKRFVEETLDSMTSDTFISHKIASKIAFDDEDDKFPIRLFWKAFISVCGDRMRTEGNALLYCKLIAITGEVLQQSIGSNMSFITLYDIWVDEIRREYLKIGD